MDTGSAELNIRYVSLLRHLFDGSTMNDTEQPVHTVSVPSFQISQSEITVGQYRICVESGTCAPPCVRYRKMHALGIRATGQNASRQKDTRLSV